MEKYCCDGIPQSFRGYVWSTLAETEKIKKKNLFDVNNNKNEIYHIKLHFLMPNLILLLYINMQYT